MLALCSMLTGTYYAQNYAIIIGRSLNTSFFNSLSPPITAVPIIIIVVYTLVVYTSYQLYVYTRYTITQCTCKILSICFLVNYKYPNNVGGAATGHDQLTDNQFSVPPKYERGTNYFL